MKTKYHFSVPDQKIFLEDPNNHDFFDEIAAPTIDYENMSYNYDHPGRKIRVFKHINPRLILDDMFAKLRINFG